MFEIEEKAFGEITEYYLRNQLTGEFVSVIPSFGATINQVVLRKGDLLAELLDSSISYEELLTEGKDKFKGCKLFPFPNRIADGKYYFHDIEHRFPINRKDRHAIHGIVADRAFEVISSLNSIDHVELLVAYKTNGKDEGYPFKTSITILFKLSIEGFSCETKIQNLDVQTIPVGDGWHPYLKTHSKIDSCHLTLPIDVEYELDINFIPTGFILSRENFFNQTKISDLLIDKCYKLSVTDEEIAYSKLEDPNQNLTIVLWQRKGTGNYNYVQVYIPPDRNSIAIEPMTCISDAFNNKIGLIELKPNESCELLFGLKLE